MIDFNKTLKENKGKYPFIAAHRGVCGANIPCNTLAAFKIAVDSGASVVELDVDKSVDGKFYIFHPGTEPIFIKNGKYLTDLKASDIDDIVLLNQDETKTSYHIPTFEEALLFLKDKVYINVDKFWMDIKGMSQVIRKCKVEKQVIVKIPNEEKYYEEVKKYAPDFMLMPMVWHKDEITDIVKKQGINIIGVEALFDKDDDEICSDEYIKQLHDKGMYIWGNAIIYDERAVISAHHTDDLALTKDKEAGWGYFVKKQFDFIQTDWALYLKQYLDSLN